MKSVSEIDAEILRLQQIRIDVEKKEQEELRLKNFEKASAMLEGLRDMVIELQEMGYLPPRIDEALTDQKGKFNPGMYIKKPRAPRGDHDAPDTV